MPDAVGCEPQAGGYEPPVLIELGDFFMLTSSPGGFIHFDGWGRYGHA